jgi:hypothetical protein
MENFIRPLTGASFALLCFPLDLDINPTGIRFHAGFVDPSLPRSKRLLPDERSNVFVDMTGHDKNELLKFQDNE